MKVLVIEDEKDLAAVLKKGLEENMFTVDLAYDGEEGMYLAENFSYDVIVLDLMLPVVDGLQILKKLREINNDVPVVILTAKSEVEERVKGLNLGADDYIIKPFSFAELIARLRAVVRRHKGTPKAVIQIADLTIDLNTHSVYRAGKQIKLTANEYRVLEYLAINRQRVVSRSELLEHIYHMDADPDSNVIDVYISYLRNKIDKGYEKKLIHTVRGMGYILKEE